MFVIKKTATATKENTDFKDNVYTYYYGVGEHLISKNTLPISKSFKWLVLNYAYKTRYQAEKQARRLQEQYDKENYCLWNFTFEVEEVSC